MSRIGTFRDTCTRFVARHHFAVEETQQGNTVTIQPWINAKAPAGLRAKLAAQRNSGPPTRRDYLTIIETLDTKREYTHFVGVLESLRLRRLVELRNGSVHAFDAIRKRDVSDAWGGDVGEIIPEIVRIAGLVGITGAERDPYTVLQGALLRLLSAPDTSPGVNA